MKRSHRDFGSFVSGVLLATGLQCKAVAIEMGTHPSEVSRIVNNPNTPTDEQIFRVGRAVGRLEERSRGKAA